MEKQKLTFCLNTLYRILKLSNYSFMVKLRRGGNMTKKEPCGVIYILTNPSFPEYVKIGYADNVEKRLKDLNRSECIPFAFRLFAFYRVNNRLTDLKLHEMIDKLNPNLRSVENFEGKVRKREFYAMSPEQAYGIFETIAEVNDSKENLVLIKPSRDDLISETEAAEIRAKRSPIKKPTLKHLLAWGIVQIGETLYYINHKNESAILLDDSGVVDFNGVKMKYMDWGRQVMKIKNFNFYDYACRYNSEKTLADERLEYMLENNIPVDENFMD